MARDDHNGQVAVLQAVGILVRRKIVASESQSQSHAGWRRAIKHEAVLTRNLIVPVVLRVASRPPRGI